MIDVDATGYRSTGLTVTLPVAPPYDWRAISGFLAMRAIPGVEIVDAAGHYHRTITLGERHGTVTVVADLGVPAFLVTIRFPDVTAVPTIVERVERIFDLAVDPIVIATALGTDPTLAPLVAARPGLRVPGAWDGFELAIRAILGQQITVRAATRLAGKLVAHYGAPLDPTGVAGLTHTFPKAETLANADLTLLGMPRSRARALSAVAAASVADPALFAPGRGLASALARLKTLRGIGDWTAHYIAMRALREPDAFPPGDIGLMRALADATGRRPTGAELLSRAEAWRPWRAYAALHLWTSETP